MDSQRFNAYVSKKLCSSNHCKISSYAWDEYLPHGWRYLLNEIQDILVINEVNITPVDCFLRIFFLLHLEDVLRHIHEPRSLSYIVSTELQLSCKLSNHENKHCHSLQVLLVSNNHSTSCRHYTYMLTGLETINQVLFCLSTRLRRPTWLKCC